MFERCILGIETAKMSTQTHEDVEIFIEFSIFRDDEIDPGFFILKILTRNL